MNLDELADMIKAETADKRRVLLVFPSAKAQHEAYPLFQRVCQCPNVYSTYASMPSRLQGYRVDTVFCFGRWMYPYESLQLLEYATCGSREPRILNMGCDWVF